MQQPGHRRDRDRCQPRQRIHEICSSCAGLRLGGRQGSCSCSAVRAIGIQPDRAAFLQAGLGDGRRRADHPLDLLIVDALPIVLEGVEIKEDRHLAGGGRLVDARLERCRLRAVAVQWTCLSGSSGW